MLVLSRKAGESIVLSDGVVVTICRIAGNRVTVGIEAPLDITVTRSELIPTAQPEKPPRNRFPMPDDLET